MPPHILRQPVGCLTRSDLHSLYLFALCKSKEAIIFLTNKTVSPSAEAAYRAILSCVDKKVCKEATGNKKRDVRLVELAPCPQNSLQNLPLAAFSAQTTAASQARHYSKSLTQFFEAWGRPRQSIFINSNQAITTSVYAKEAKRPKKDCPLTGYVFVNTGVVARFGVFGADLKNRQPSASPGSAKPRPPVSSWPNRAGTQSRSIN